MTAQAERTGIEAPIATFPEDERRGFPARPTAPQLPDTIEEAEAKLANGEYRPGDRFVLVSGGRRLIVTFCGTVSCC